MQRLFYTSLKSTTSMFLPIQDIDGEIRNVHYYDSWAIANNNSNNNHVDPPNSSSYPPLIILGGTGQTVDTYAPHIRALSKERRLLIIELRCQGRTELLSEYGTVQQQVSDIKQILDKLKIEKCDLLGFSFGGRVGLAVASKMNGVVNKLTVTGVPLRRPALGQIILKSWHDSLKLNEMRSCAWSFLINGYSEKFLNKFATKLSLFVDIIIKSNDPKRLFHLLEHSHVVDDSHPFSVPNCLATITCLTQVCSLYYDGACK
jgi:pimeloyl-ACP methyl ester carboxylesterase